MIPGFLRVGSGSTRVVPIRYLCGMFANGTRITCSKLSIHRRLRYLVLWHWICIVPNTPPRWTKTDWYLVSITSRCGVKLFRVGKWLPRGCVDLEDMKALPYAWEVHFSHTMQRCIGYYPSRIGVEDESDGTCDFQKLTSKSISRRVKRIPKPVSYTHLTLPTILLV